MALQKEIETNTGIITNYHRILSINSIINKEIQIIGRSIERPIYLLVFAYYSSIGTMFSASLKMASHLARHFLLSVFRGQDEG